MDISYPFNLSHSTGRITFPRKAALGNYEQDSSIPSTLLDDTSSGTAESRPYVATQSLCPAGNVIGREIAGD